MKNVDEIVLPPRQYNPTAWLGINLLRHPTRWMTKLSSDHVKELQNAASKVLSAGMELKDITWESFPLPTYSLRTTGSVELRRNADVIKSPNAFTSVKPFTLILAM